MKPQKIQDVRKSKLVYGVGVNDAAYDVYAYEKTEGSRNAVWRCPFHAVWSRMLERCYSKSSLKRCPTYVGCEVCSEWQTFSVFRAWMESQDWEGRHLDKDLLISGNKIYSPDRCVFVSKQMNAFLLDHAAARGDFPIGVTWNQNLGKFRAKCNNPFTGKREHLGYFVIPQAAHEAWRRRKHELACKYADMQTNPRLAEALRTRFASEEIKEMAA